MSLADDVQAKVDVLIAEIAQGITLMDTLKAELDAALAGGSDAATLQAISDKIGAVTTRLSTAIATDTPATPAPTPAP